MIFKKTKKSDLLRLGEGEVSLLQVFLVFCSYVCFDSFGLDCKKNLVIFNKNKQTNPIVSKKNIIFQKKKPKFSDISISQVG